MFSANDYNPKFFCKSDTHLKMCLMFSQSHALLAAGAAPGQRHMAGRQLRR
jgi:hypothetical protein